MNQDSAAPPLRLTLGELSQRLGIEAERILAMVEEGIIEPLEGGERYCFSVESLYRVGTVVRLQRDLRINLAGAALALQLLDEISALRSRVTTLEQLLFEEEGGEK